MPLAFPPTPATDDVYTFNGRSWVFNGEGWDFQGSTGGGESGGATHLIETPFLVLADARIAGGLATNTEVTYV